MTNAETNKGFLETTDRLSRRLILAHIAKAYEITPEEAYEEVTSDEAEHLLDYMTYPERAAASALMKRHGFSK